MSVIFNLFNFMARINQLLKFFSKKYFFPHLKKYMHNFDSFTLNGYCCVGQHHVLFDSLRESVPLTKQSGTACFRDACSASVCLAQHTG